MRDHAPLPFPKPPTNTGCSQQPPAVPAPPIKRESDRWRDDRHPPLRSIPEIWSEIEKRQRHVAVYAQYRDVCIERRDRHGIMDAEADMRELEAGIRALCWVLGEPTA